ncbi:hypothetical protein BCON_0128g00050 [Botryotinia convoluta]|uniref:DUF6594 domain-containing protein n=1 Tax=Botryotinia convoluta TaxID=54673 RepID=A0A4Z1HVE5_9HELO|nr:hypothetical protein BCON_0128g00050 [Botryotinia convoluta]
MASILPVMTIVVLYLVASMVKRLALVRIFTTILSVCIWFMTDGRLVEVFSATSAYDVKDGDNQSHKRGEIEFACLLNAINISLCQLGPFCPNDGQLKETKFPMNGIFKSITSMTDTSSYTSSVVKSFGVKQLRPRIIQATSGTEAVSKDGGYSISALEQAKLNVETKHALNRPK